MNWATRTQTITHGGKAMRCINDMLVGVNEVFTDIGFATYERKMDEREMRIDRRRKVAKAPKKVIEVFETIPNQATVNKPGVSVVTI